MESCRADCEGPEEQQREEEEEEGTGSKGGLYEAIAGKGLGAWTVPRAGGTNLTSRVTCVCLPQGTGFGSCNAGSAVWGTQLHGLVACSLSLTSFPTS